MSDLKAVMTNVSGELQKPASFSVTSTGSTTARSLSDRFAERVNVVDFGADPAGLTDSTSSIQAANDYATTNQCGYVYFPRGQYLVTETLTWSTPWIGDRGASVPSGPNRGWSVAPVRLAYGGVGGENFIQTIAAADVQFDAITFLSMENLTLIPNTRSVTGLVSAVWNAGVVTVTTNAPHNARVGDYVDIGNANNFGLAQTREITNVSSSTILQFSLTSDFGSISGTPFVRVTNARPTVGVDHRRRADSGISFRNMHILQCTQAGIWFRKGGLNVNIRDLRTDGVGGYGIRFNSLGLDSISIEGCYFENAGSGIGHAGDPVNGSSGGGGGICLDNSTVETNTGVLCNVRDGVFEINVSQEPDTGMIRIINRPNASSFVQTNLILDGISGNVNPSANFKGVLVLPASDGVRIHQRNIYGMPITGVPSLLRNINSSAASRALNNVVGPHSLTVNASPASEHTAMNVSGDLNVSQYYMEGRKVIPLLEGSHTDSWFDGSPVRTNRGMWFLDGNLNVEIRRITEIASEGVLGSINGITVSGSSGQATLTITSGSDAEILKLKRQFLITIGTSPTSETKRIVSVDYENKTIAVTTDLTNTYTDAAVSFPAPATRMHQLMSKRNGQPSTGTFAKGDFLFASIPTVSGHGETIIGYQRLTDGSSNTLGTDWVAVYAPTARNIVSTSAPSSAPDFVGQMYVNTSSGIAYIAVGISNTSDWKALANWNP